MKNVKTLTATILICMGLLTGGCGNNGVQVNNAPTQQTQEVKQDNGISLGKAIELAKKGQFTPQKVKFEATINEKVFGDEPEIIVQDWIKMGELHKPVNIHITDPEIIKRVAKLQEEQKNNYVRGTGTIDAKEIIFNKWSVEVK
nr:MAG TPA: lipoprotein [Caudoviricetes sp.]